MNTKSLYPILLVASLAPNCWAPINQPPPEGHIMLHEATQAELAHQQKLQRTQGQVGFVPMKTNENPEVPAEISDHTAGANIVAAQAQAEARESEQAKQVLQQADKRVKAGEPRNDNVLWGILFGVFGFGTVMGLRTWAAKAIPVPTNPKPEPIEPTFPKRQNW